MEALATSISDFGSLVFRLATIAVVIVNGIAIAAVVVTRDRLAVNRWTPRIVAANLFLVGAGVGVPLATKALSFVIQAVATTQSTEIQLNTK